MISRRVVEELIRLTEQKIDAEAVVFERQSQVGEIQVAIERDDRSM